jgi:hypothetical protein
MRRNPDDAQLAERPRNLRRRHPLPVQPFALLLPFAFDGYLEHARLIRVERQRPAEPLQIRPQQAHVLLAGVVPHEARQ